jgi:hypothetical protein
VGFLRRRRHSPIAVPVLAHARKVTAIDAARRDHHLLGLHLERRPAPLVDAFGSIDLAATQGQPLDALVEAQCQSADVGRGNQRLRKPPAGAQLTWKRGTELPGRNSPRSTQLTTGRKLTP